MESVQAFSSWWDVGVELHGWGLQGSCLSCHLQGVVDWTHHGGYMSPGHLPYSFFPSFLILLVIQKGILGAWRTCMSYLDFCMEHMAGASWLFIALFIQIWFWVYFLYPLGSIQCFVVVWCPRLLEANVCCCPTQCLLSKLQEMLQYHFWYVLPYGISHGSLRLLLTRMVSGTKIWVLSVLVATAEGGYLFSFCFWFCSISSCSPLEDLFSSLHSCYLSSQTFSLDIFWEI